MTTEQTSDTGRSKKERLEARVSAELKELFSRAAALEGCTLTDYVVRTLQDAAARTIREHERMLLTAEDREAFVGSLINPPPPNERLRRAAYVYRNITDA